MTFGVTLPLTTSVSDKESVEVKLVIKYSLMYLYSKTVHYRHIHI